VKIVIDRVLENPLRRTKLRDDPVLNDLGILHFANATVFEVTPAQEARLRDLMGEGFTTPREPFTVDSIVRAASRPPRQLILDEEIYASVFAALDSGKHVILTGPWYSQDDTYRGCGGGGGSGGTVRWLRANDGDCRLDDL
jgi:hypothetical protein